jgi:outer membrane protein assembly factor BamB
MNDDTLYIGCNGYVAAIRAADGAQLWRTALSTGLISATAGEDVCVLQHQGRVYAGCQGHLYCLDAASGRILWLNQLSGLGYNDVTLAIGDKSVQFVATHTHTDSSS